MPTFDVSYYAADGNLLRCHAVDAEDHPSAARKSRWPDNAVRKEVKLLKNSDS